MRIFPLISAFLVCFCSSALAQQNNNWYFGRKAGITFNITTAQQDPVSLQNSAMMADEGCSTMSDSTGKLLFYTNGVTVYNKIHEVMLNGDDIGGNISACQSSIIIPQPGSNHLYYIFTTDALENSFNKGYRYSVVDINMDGGKGQVVSKDVMLWASCTERLVAARHYNGVDVWIITNDNNSDTFRSWLLTCNGLQPAPTVSHAGIVLDYSIVVNTGFMKVSPDGKMFCQTHFPMYDPDVSIPNFFQLFDFDNTTGTISNGRTIAFGGALYVGCEFSPDSKLLYITRPYEKKIDQLEPTLATTAAVGASTVTLATDFPSFAIQLGPDEKIYVFKQDISLGVVNSPDIKGLGCTFRTNQVDLSPWSGYLGSPAFINDIAYDGNNSFTYRILDSCSGTVQFNGFSTMSGNLSWEWDFGDGNTSTLQNPLHVFTPSNLTYTVKLKVTSDLTCGTIRSSRTIKPSGISGKVEFDFVTRCDSGYTRFINLSNSLIQSGMQFHWDFGDGNTSNDINPIHSFGAAGHYPVTLNIVTSTPCLNSAVTHTVDIFDFVINAPPDQTVLVGNPVLLSATGPPATYLWTPSSWVADSNSKSTIAYPLDDILYKVIATNGEGCKAMDSVLIHVVQYRDIFVPTAFTPNNDGRNDIIKPFYPGNITLKNFTIYNRWGQMVFSTGERGAGWNGMVNGLIQQTGVYIWTLQATDKSGQRIDRKGSVTLIR